jgi:hypothetical protein
MKLSIAILVSAATGVVACSHDSRPVAVQAPSTAATQTALVSTAPPAEPGALNIPTNNPTVPAPIPPAPKAPDETPLTPSAGAAAARPSVAPSTPLDPTLDKAESSDDQESVREIRALLAADKSLSSTARKVTVSVRKGRVRLSGQVNTAEERAAVERSARQAANVIDVRNELVVLQ